MSLTPPTQEAVVSQFRSLMAVADPEIDTTVGSTVRKIFDVAAEVIAEAYVDVYMMSYQRDLDTRTGADLDDYVGQFGFRRLQGTRATGVVVVERHNPDPTSVFFPARSEFITSAEPRIRFLSVVPVVLTASATSVDIPLQAVLTGTQGNVEANRIDTAISVAGFDSVSNPVGMANGTNPESDRELRSRFRKTLFRNMAGTECQPPGTQVLVPVRGRERQGGHHGRAGVELIEVPIESLREGDYVVSYRQGAILRRGRQVNGITSREFSGRLIVVRTEDGRESRYTPNHRCFARLGPALADKKIVYLMRRGGSYRIGKTSGSSGLTSRLASEKADDIWVLSLHDTSREALAAELFASWRFNIPMTLFETPWRDRKKGFQESLDDFWIKVGDLTSQAMVCLEAFDRDIRYPMASRGQHNVWSRATEVRASNLIDGCEVVDVQSMLLADVDQQHPPTEYTPVQVTSVFYEGPVWSMDVAGPSSYIADGFATHNSMFLGIALDNDWVSKAIVIGATQRHREQVEIVTGAASSGLIDSKYIFPETDSLLTADGQTVFTREVHYTFDDGDIVIINDTIIPDGIYLLEYDYSPIVSRNEPTQGITNRVDVYSNGQRAVQAVETVVFRTARVFNNTADHALNRSNFRRSDGTFPTLNNIFIGFGFTPVMIPATTGEIVIGGSTFVEDVDFWLIRDVSPKGGGPNTLSGIEWLAASVVANGTIFPVEYVYNQVPSIVENAIRRWRLTGWDVKAHEGLPTRFNLHLTVVPREGFSKALIEASLSEALSGLINGLDFASIVQVSDILSVASNDSGVDEVRFTTSVDDDTNYAIQRVAADGTTILEVHQVGGRATNVYLKSNEYAVLNQLVVTLKAAGTFGTP